MNTAIRTDIFISRDKNLVNMMTVSPGWRVS